MRGERRRESALRTLPFRRARQPPPLEDCRPGAHRRPLPSPSGAKTEGGAEGPTRRARGGFPEIRPRFFCGPRENISWDAMPLLSVPMSCRRLSAQLLHIRAHLVQRIQSVKSGHTYVPSPPRSDPWEEAPRYSREQTGLCCFLGPRTDRRYSGSRERPPYRSGALVFLLHNQSLRWLPVRGTSSL